MPPKAAPPVAVADPSKFCYISCCNEYNVPEICSSSNCQLDLLLSWARQQFVASLSNIIQNCDEESKQKLSSIRNQLAQLKANSFELTDSAGMRLNVQENLKSNASSILKGRVHYKLCYVDEDSTIKSFC